MSYNQNYTVSSVLNPLVHLDTLSKREDCRGLETTVGTIHRSLNNNYSVINHISPIGKIRQTANTDNKLDNKSDPKLESKSDSKTESKTESKTDKNESIDKNVRTDNNQPEQVTLKNSKIQNNTSELSKDNEVINTDQDTSFKQLSYTDVQINLRLLSDLKEGEKVMIVDHKYMQVDQRYGQSFRRYWTSDSRIRTLSFIGHIINWAKYYCNEAVEKINNNEQKQINMEKLINIQTLLRSALTGLSRISTTYSNDKHNLATIETYKSTIQTICDHDLKRAINEKSHLDQSI
jgi:hypothetical protein